MFLLLLLLGAFVFLVPPFVVLPCLVFAGACFAFDFSFGLGALTGLASAEHRGSRGAREILDALSALPPKPLPRYLPRYLPRPAQHHHPASATNRSRAHPQAHTRSQREQRRHPAISHRNRCARTVKRPGGPVPALLQNSEIDLFTHSPFASRPLTHSHGAPFGGALRAR